MKLMTSSVQCDNNVLDDFEEGEILDDDSPISSHQDPPDEPKCEQFDSFGINEPFLDNVSWGKCQVALHSVRGRNSPKSNLKRYNRDGLPFDRRRRFRSPTRRNDPRPVAHNTFYHRKQGGNERDRYKSDDSYEEKLRDFRQQRINSNRQKPYERKPKKSPSSGSINSRISGSSLLKRLVGSGSMGIKIIEENVNEPINSNANQCSSPAKEIKVPENVNIPIIESGHVGSNDTSLTEGQAKTLISTNENSPSAQQDENEELNLRMEALKTAVLKKHNERLKRGYIPKKVSSDGNDPTSNSFIEEVEAIYSCNDLFVNCGDDQNSVVKKTVECSDMSLDSNYVSDEEVPIRDNPTLLNSVVQSKLDRVPVVKRTRVSDEQISKKAKLEEKFNDEDIVSDVNDEELQLRALALKSLDKNKALKGTETKNDKTADFKAEIDAPEKNKDVDNWEELDEDILRAELLKTLSASLPDTVVNTVVYNKLDLSNSITMQKMVVPSSSKKEPDMELEIQCQLWSERMVPKFVISLDSDSESDEPEPPSLDFVRSLDLLLQEAKQKSEKSSQIKAKAKIKKKNPVLKLPVKKPLLKKPSSSTPMAVKHLPIQQQEEYRRLKIKLAEKMKSNSLKNPDASKRAVQIISKSVVDPKIRLKIDSDISLINTTLSSKQNLENITETRKVPNRILLESAETLKKNVEFALKPESKIVKRTEVGVTLKPNVQVASKHGTKLRNKKEVDVTLKPDVQVSLESKYKGDNTIDGVISKPNATQVVLEPKNEVINKPEVGAFLKPNDRITLKPKIAITHGVSAIGKPVVKKIQSQVRSSEKADVKEVLKTVTSNVLKADFPVDLKSNTSAVIDRKREDISRLQKRATSEENSKEDLNVTELQDDVTLLKETNVTGESDVIIRTETTIPLKSNAQVSLKLEPMIIDITKAIDTSKLDAAREEERLSNHSANKSGMPGKLGSDTAALINIKKDRVAPVDKINGVLINVNSGSSKDNDGYSGKENEVIKVNKTGVMDSEIHKHKNSNRLPPPALLPSVGYLESNLVNKLHQAELKYRQTYKLASRLERELEAARKDLATQAKDIALLKEKINIPLGPSPSPDNAKCSGDGYSEVQKSVENTSAAFPIGARYSWDPDGVLCPFQLSGSCKDPLCSFHHIPTS